MKNILIALCMLNIILLVMTLVEFIALDRKLDKAIERQNEINGKTYEILQAQEKALRIMETNNEIMFSIIVNGDYYEKD